MFGTNSVLNLPFPVAAKTGTSNDFRDNWTLGYTPDLVTGVWIGNADYTPMVNTTGLSGAAPIWSQFMQYAVPRLTGGMAVAVHPAGRHHGQGRVPDLGYRSLGMVSVAVCRGLRQRPAAGQRRAGPVARDGTGHLERLIWLPRPAAATSATRNW